MKRMLYLATAALVALLILVPTAFAQEDTVVAIEEETVIMQGDLPKSGGPAVGSAILPAAALLLGSGVLAYAVLRRR